MQNKSVSFHCKHCYDWELIILDPSFLFSNYCFDSWYQVITNSITPLVSGSICVLSAINCPNVASVWKENRKTGALYCTVLMLTLASTRNITMEGKWRPMDWRYRSYGLEPKPQCFSKPDNVVFLPQTKLILCDEGPMESLQVDLFRHHCFGNGVKCHNPFFVSILFMFLVFFEVRNKGS